jgi:hypothetical protein
MKTSERATASIRELPERDQPLSEQYRIVAKAWVEMDGAARMLESCKDAVLSEMIGRRAGMPVARAERDAKASPEWSEYLKQMVSARTAANLKKVQLNYIRMKHSEWVSNDANARAERKL